MAGAASGTIRAVILLTRPQKSAPCPGHATHRSNLTHPRRLGGTFCPPCRVILAALSRNKADVCLGFGHFSNEIMVFQAWHTASYGGCHANNTIFREPKCCLSPHRPHPHGGCRKSHHKSLIKRWAPSLASCWNEVVSWRSVYKTDRQVLFRGTDGAYFHSRRNHSSRRSR